MKRFIFLALMMPVCAFSQMEAVGVHLFSRHDPNGGENQYNPGFFLRFSHGVTVGQYTNSLSRHTNYVGWTSPEWHRLRLSVLAATGYTKKNAVVVPVPSVKLYQFDDGGPSLWLSGVPFQVADSRAVGHIHVEWKFK